MSSAVPVMAGTPLPLEHTVSRALLLFTLVMPLPAPATRYQGFAASYPPGVMQQVGRRRGMHAACMVAHTYLPLGTWVRVRGVRLGRVRRCLVVDVPQPRHRGVI